MSHGTTHAANAAAATSVAAALARPLGFHPGVDLTDLVVFAHSVACLATGAALIPDVDHPQSTIARTGGALGRPLAWLIDKVTDHRRETHSLITAAAVSGGLAVAQHFAPAVGVVIATVLTGLAFDLRKPGTNVLAAAVRFGLAFATVATLSRLGDAAAWLATETRTAPIAVDNITWGHAAPVMFVGWVIACLGDACTNSGAYLLYVPLPRQLAPRLPRLAAATGRRYHLTRPGREWRMVPGRWSLTERRIYAGSFVVIAVSALSALGVLDALAADVAARPEVATFWQTITETVHEAV